MDIKLSESVMRHIVLTRIENGKGKDYDHDFIDRKISLSEWQEFEKNKESAIKEEERKKEIQEENKRLETVKTETERLKEKGAIQTDKNTAEILLLSGLGIVLAISLITYIKNR